MGPVKEAERAAIHSLASQETGKSINQPTKQNPNSKKDVVER